MPNNSRTDTLLHMKSHSMMHHLFGLHVKALLTTSRRFAHLVEELAVLWMRRTHLTHEVLYSCRGIDSEQAQTQTQSVGVQGLKTKGL